MRPVGLAPWRIAGQQSEYHDAELPGIARKATDEFLIFYGFDNLGRQEVLPCMLDAIDENAATCRVPEIAQLDACEI